jgi:quercetin dioxygenase-like cupin family protein
MWVLDGRARTLGTALDPGAYLHIPSGVKHDIDAPTSGGCTVLFPVPEAHALTPIRDDGDRVVPRRLDHATG